MFTFKFGSHDNIIVVLKTFGKGTEDVFSSGTQFTECHVWFT